MTLTAIQRSAAESRPIDGEASVDLSRADFEQIRALIRRRAGINLHEGKRAMVYSRLVRRLRERGHTTFGSYLRWLDSSTGETAEREWQEFVNCLTTNLTSFFREDHHFPILAERLLENQGRRQRVWCNAASTGEEPYSIAMTVVETLGVDANVELVCSDIDTRVLAVAGQGVYPADSRGLPPELMRRYFLRGTGPNSGSIRVKPELRQIVGFQSFNLMDARWSLGEPFDIVFCRNVMIYFDAATQRKVLERMHKAMAPGARLFAGHSENFSESRDLFRLLGKTVYERV